MSSRFRDASSRVMRASRTVLGAALVAIALAGCEREKRHFQSAAPGSIPPGSARNVSIVPGPARHVSAAPGSANASTDSALGPYGHNAYAVSQGQRLFNWYNCSGCHSNGGGGMGPPLMDDKWIYGSGAQNIYESIVQGRPNGMPSWGGRIPDQNIWQLVAYVQSLSALTPSATRSARSDHMMMKPGSQALSKPARPKPSTLPPSAEKP